MHTCIHRCVSPRPIYCGVLLVLQNGTLSLELSRLIRLYRRCLRTVGVIMDVPEHRRFDDRLRRLFNTAVIDRHLALGFVVFLDNLEFLFTIQPCVCFHYSC